MAAGQSQLGLGHKVRDARNRDGNIVFDVQALFGLRQWNALADMPQRARLGDVLCHHRVNRAPLFYGGLQQSLELHTRVGFGFGVRVLQHHAIRHGLEKRHALLRKVFVHQAQRELAHDLETRQARAQVAMGQAQKLHCRFQRGQGDQCGHLGPWCGVELHDRRGDDAQRAFGPDKQVAQVVAGIVLAQAGQAIPYLALRCHHFQPQA